LFVLFIIEIPLHQKQDKINVEQKNIKVMKKLFLLMSVVLATMVSFSSCNDSDDQKEARVISGEWQGNWGMWYEDDYGYRYNATSTYIKFIPDYSGATHGWGKQEDFYNYDTTGRYRSAYKYLYYKFEWSVRNGILYIEYPYDSELDTYIRDYSLSNDYFSGYFGNSNTRFRLSKLSDWYYWTPDVYVESDYYGWTVWSSASKQFEQGAGAKAYEGNMPQIVKRGGHFQE